MFRLFMIFGFSFIGAYAYSFLSGYFENVYADIFMAVSFASVLSLFLINSKISQHGRETIEIDKVVHDLKTPVHGQMIACDLILKGNFGDISPELLAIIKQIKESCLYMLDNIGSLLFVSKNNSCVKFNESTFDINRLAEECINEVKLYAEQHLIKVIFDFEQKVTLVKADRHEIKRVILNLITNAVNYSKKHSVVTVYTRLKNNKAMFSVHNFGEYISEKDLKRIFNKYVSLNNIGTGLGLYISSEIIKKHGCKLAAKSDKNTGNSFFFDLPISYDIPTYTVKK